MKFLLNNKVEIQMKIFICLLLVFSLIFPIKAQTLPILYFQDINFKNLNINKVEKKSLNLKFYSTIEKICRKNNSLISRNNKKTNKKLFVKIFKTKTYEKVIYEKDIIILELKLKNNVRVFSFYKDLENLKSDIYNEDKFLELFLYNFLKTNFF